MAGDVPCSPTSLTVGSSCSTTEYDNSSMGDSGFGAPSCASYGGGPDMWFTVTVPATGIINIETISTGKTIGTDIDMEVFSGAVCGSLSSIQCTDGGSSIPGANTYDAGLFFSGRTPGETLWIRIWGYTGGSGTFDVCAYSPTPPSNDECSSAISLTVNSDQACGSTTSGTVASATPSADANSCYNTYDTDDVWFSFQANSTTHYIDLLNIAGSQTDMVHAVYSGTCGSLTEIACSDPNSSTATGLTIGDIYYVRVYTWSTSAETTTFDVCIGSPPPMTYTGGNTTTYQDNSSNIPKCSGDADIMRIEIVTAGGASNPLDVTELQFNMTGTTLSDIDNVDIFYTTTASFDNSVLFGSATPTGGTITINGTQTLDFGTNYFWIAYDIASGAGLNSIDASCTQVTIDASTDGTSAGSNGSRTISACVNSPGGAGSNIQTWLRADNGTSTTTDGNSLSTWSDQTSLANDGTRSGTSRPLYRRNSTNNSNFNPGIDFDGSDDFLDLPDNTFASGDGAYSIYAVVRPDSKHESSPGKIMCAGEDFGAASTDRWIAMDIRDTKRIMHGWNQNDLWHSNNIYETDRPLIYGILYDNSSSSERETYSSSTSGTYNVADNPGASRNNTSTYNYLGKTSAHNEFYDGIIHEVISYTEKHSSTDRYKVESYLGIKYGVSLEHNYLDSYGEIIWDYSANSSYNTQIIGIGRDDVSVLEQKQSKSEHTGSILTMSNNGAAAADNLANSNNFSSDRSYFITGHNNGATSGIWQSSPFTTTNSEIIESLFQRKWKSQESGTVGTITLEFDLSAVPGVASAGDNDLANVRLLVDANGAFASGAQSVSPSSFNNTTDIVQFQFDFTGATGFFFTLGSIDYTSAPLPIELSEFGSTCKDNSINLSWLTLSEINNDYFVLEASKDGETYSEIAQIDGAGNSNSPQHYSYDHHFYNGHFQYFRIKQVDFNGAATVSQILVENCDEKIINLEIYPNPASSQITIRYPDIDNNQIQLYITDNLGAIVKSISIEKNNSTFSSTIDIGEIANGLYHVTLESNHLKLSKKLIITK